MNYLMKRRTFLGSSFAAGMAMAGLENRQAIQLKQIV